MSRLGSAFPHISLSAFSLCSSFTRTLLLVLALMLACAGAAKADIFTTGEFVTYDQSAWSGVPAASTLLLSNFSTVYAPSGVVTVGLPITGFTMKFNDPAFILVYLPAGGSPGPLTGNVINPATTPAGAFGGDVLALELNVDFNNAGFLHGTSSVLFGNLVLQNLSTCSQLDGLTVSEFLAIDNTALGGGSTSCSIPNLDAISGNVNASFDGGTPSTFAQTNLALPTSAVPESSSLLLLGAGLLGFAIRRALHT